MSQMWSRSERLVLDTLQSPRSMAMEEMTKRIPELSWNELFHAVDSLSRRGEVILRREGFVYHLSLPRMANAPA